MTELDRLAAAYCDTFIGERWKRVAPGEYELDDTTFAELAGSEQELIRQGVRAILTAMRDRRRGRRTLDWADDPLFDAPGKAGVEGEMSAWVAYQAWRAMIDHILSEGAP